MSLELVKALLTILKICMENDDCHKCPLRAFCKKMPTEW